MRIMIVLERHVYNELDRDGELLLKQTYEELNSEDGRFIEYYADIIRRKTRGSIPFSKPIIGYMKLNGKKSQHLSKSELSSFCEGFEEPVVLHCKVPNEVALAVSYDEFDICYHDYKMKYKYNKEGFESLLRGSTYYNYRTTETELTMIPVLYKRNIVKTIFM